MLNGVVLAGDRDQVVYCEAFGLANRTWDIPNSIDTVFPISSITKYVTAILFMRLVEAGKIDLQESLLAYLPEYRNDSGAKITVHHLLTNTSGIPNYNNLPGFDKIDIRLAYDRFEFAISHCSHDLLFEPGEHFEYSNSGYHLLGLIVERVTETTYENALYEFLFKPVGMLNSGVLSNSIVVKSLASGYDYEDGKFKSAKYVDLSLLYSSGGVYSTAMDMFRLDRALRTYSILSEDSVDLIHTHHIPAKATYYGYGCIILPFTCENGRQVKLVAVPGAIPGFDSILYRGLDEEKIVLVLTNSFGNRPQGLPTALLNIVYSDD